MYCTVGTTPCNLVRSQKKKMHRAARLKNLPHTYSVLHWSGHLKKSASSLGPKYICGQRSKMKQRSQSSGLNKQLQNFLTFYAPIWPLPLCIAFQGYTKMADTVKKYISAAQVAHFSLINFSFYIDKKTACNFLSLVT